MEKLMYLLSRPSHREAGEFRDQLLDEIAPSLLTSEVAGLTLNVADVDALPGSIHLSDPAALLGASLSLWLDSLDGRGPIEERLASVCGRLAGYLVTESVPRDYAQRDWPDGERSPGVTLVAAFPMARGIDAETFFSQWQQHHTPLSLSLHPLTRYLRNSVARVLTPGAPPYQALVEERVADIQDLLDPMRFFGSEEAQERAFEHVQRFTDIDEMHTALMSEYILRSFPAGA